MQISETRDILVQTLSQRSRKSHVTQLTDIEFLWLNAIPFVPTMLEINCIKNDALCFFMAVNRKKANATPNLLNRNSWT